jgi:hypothetical protein
MGNSCCVSANRTERSQNHSPDEQIQQKTMKKAVCDFVFWFVFDYGYKIEKERKKIEFGISLIANILRFLSIFNKSNFLIVCLIIHVLE